MPNVPTNSVLGYIGVFLVFSGIFLLISGAGIISVEKIEVLPGVKTFGVGVVLLIIGLLMLFPEILVRNGVPTPTFTPTPELTQSTFTPTPDETMTPTVEIPTATSTVEAVTPTPPTITPEITPTVEVIEPIYFHETFLEEGFRNRWVVNENGGELTFLENGGLRLVQDNSDRFPYLLSSGDPFPKDGDFQVTIVLRHINADGLGNGIAIGVCCENNATPYISNEATTLLRIWQGDGGTNLTKLNYGTDIERIHFLGEYATFLGEQTLVVQYTNENIVTVVINDQTVATFKSIQRPNKIWIGNFKKVSGVGDWSDFEVYSIQVEKLQ